MELKFRLNGADRSLQVPPRLTLLDAIRDYAGLTGTKYGCGEGQCGACTVLLDGQAVKSCILPAASAQGKEVTTIEGLAVDGKLHPVQQAFLDHSAFQCGFCTPGMITGAVSFLAQHSHPSEADIRAGLQSHICRCGTYPRIVAAVRAVASLGKEDRRG
ncbi:(2Fe-2S)-binding protein [Paludibaculum fermentans]|uniref:(2Fe-2S)-binding protein n=1 Tax=Paludibaculum fermentans TaxID=1473598 RepID=A0A7S7SJ17_PALFE|nr:(2Fe-2S)-binding protein [Paludibaculum fermentans]QOY86243.1 (2Fe-2S)-binding protein [Paludibaculum fermentans]